MYNFNFYMPTKVLFGPGKLSELHSEQLPLSDDDYLTIFENAWR